MNILGRKIEIQIKKNSLTFPLSAIFFISFFLLSFDNIFLYIYFVHPSFGNLIG